MKLTVDQGACTGHGRCYVLAPDVFDADDVGHSVLRIDGEIPAELESQARTAVDNCPERAIRAEP